MLRKRWSSLTAAFMAAAALLAAAPLSAQALPGGGAVSARDSAGRPLSLPRPARRVVSISPAATEVLFAIGAGPAVVGVTDYCNYPPEALALPKVGAFAAPTISMERLLGLRPELVVSAGAMHGSLEAGLARFGIPVFAYEPGDFEAIARDMAALGALLGRRPEAEAAGRVMLDSIDSVRRRLAGLRAEDRPRVFWEIYDEPLMTSGAASFQRAVVEAAGGRDIFSDLPGSWPRVSAEEVIRRAPDFILGSEDHGDRLRIEAIARRPGWSTLPAVRNGRIVLLPSDPVSRPGPRIAEGVLLAARALHPELFR